MASRRRRRWRRDAGVVDFRPFRRRGDQYGTATCARARASLHFYLFMKSSLCNVFSLLAAVVVVDVVVVTVAAAAVAAVVVVVVVVVCVCVCVHFLGGCSGWRDRCVQK